MVLIFTQKADDNLASLVKAVDEVQKSNENLGTVVVGVSGVTAADFEKLQETHKLTTPLTVAVDKDGPPGYKLNKDAAVTVLVYKKGGKITKNFAFKDTKAAAAKAKDIADAATDASSNAPCQQPDSIGPSDRPRSGGLLCFGRRRTRRRKSASNWRRLRLLLVGTKAKGPPS